MLIPVLPTMTTNVRTARLDSHEYLSVELFLERRQYQCKLVSSCLLKLS